MSNNKGITLIALIITIIVLLILAGTSINLILGQNGVLNKAQNAVTETDESKEKESISLAVLDARIQDNAYIKLNQANLQDSINNEFGNGKAIVTDNGDETFTVSFVDTKKDYIVTSTGIETGINWAEKMAIAQAPIEQTNVSKNIVRYWNRWKSC